MSRSVFLLLAGVYSTLLTLSMVFAPEASLLNYGVPRVDLNHISIMQFLGLCNGGFALLALLSRNAPTSVSLCTILLVEAVVLLAGVLLGVYHSVALHVPMSAFFVGDSIFRLALGLVFLYVYNRETKQARAGGLAM